MAAATASALALRLKASAQLDPARSPQLAAILAGASDALGPVLSDLLGMPVLAAIEAARPVADDGAIHDGATHVRATFRVQPWNSDVVVAVARTALDAIVDVVFGGDGSEADGSGERPISPLEFKCARRVSGAVMRAFADAFATSAHLVFTETAVEIVEAGQAASMGAFLLVNFDVAIGTKTVPLRMLVPQSALAAFRTIVSAETPSAPLRAPDAAWTTTMRSEVVRTQLAVKAVLSEPDVTLADIAGLRIGEILPLRASLRTPIALQCEGRTLFHGALGQSDGVYTVRVADAAHETDQRNGTDGF